MKKRGLIAITMMMMLVFTACGTKTDNTKDNSTNNATTETEQNSNTTDEAEATKAPEKTFSVALVADGAGLGAQSFNDVALEGLQKAEKDFGITITTLEVKEAADLANSLRSLAQQGVNLIVTPSSGIKDAVTEVSADYPDVYFALLDVQVESLNNVVSSSYREQEAAFLLGALGASLTETDKIGYVGGISGTIQDRFQYGYMAGAAYVNKEVEVVASYTGSFSDVGKGKEIATMMYSEGADFIAPAAGACNLGVSRQLRKPVQTNGVSVQQTVSSTKCQMKS